MLQGYWYCFEGEALQSTRRLMQLTLLAVSAGSRSGSFSRSLAAEILPRGGRIAAAILFKTGITKGII